MTEPPEVAADRTTAADRVPIDHDRLPAIPAEDDRLPQISSQRRHSHAIAPPRKWRRAGFTDLVCPECRAKVPSIADGFWHLQTAHNQGRGVDLEAWGKDLRDELDEYIQAARGRRGYVEDTPHPVGRLPAALVGVMVLLVVLFIVYLIAGG